MLRIGVRELRQHASRYLAQVKAGDTIEVTERGRAVARLVPVPADPWEASLASGALRPPTDEGSLADLEPVSSSSSLGAVLQRMRDEDDR